MIINQNRISLGGVLPPSTSRIVSSLAFSSSPRSLGAVPSNTVGELSCVLDAMTLVSIQMVGGEGQ